jgi:predicted patatin/cPLA2 family phospholipase
MVLMSLGASSGVVAKEAQAAQWAPQVSEKRVAFSESKLRAFEKVHKKVTKRTKKYHRKIKKAKTEKAKLKLAAKAKRDVVKIIEKSSLTMTEYYHILSVLMGKRQI